MEFKFMVKFPFIIVFFFVACMQISNGCLEDERLSLLHIKAFFLSINYKIVFDRLSSWTGVDCCNWERVKCDVDIGSHVVELSLHRLLDYDFTMKPKYLLNVSLFQNFKELRRLDVSVNALFGFTEDKGFNEFSNLKKLETLKIGINNFGNDIGLSLSGLTSLKKLTLNHIGLEDSFFLHDLENLRELDLSGNRLNPILHMPGLEKLKKLDLSANNWEGTLKMQELLPKTNSQNLRELSLVGNRLNGLEGISSLKRLEILDLRENHFDNNIFSSLSELISLKTLRLCSNHLRGSIPMQDIAKLKGLKILNLNDNNYSGGAISLQDLKYLRILGLSMNGFHGALPIQGLCETNNLVELDIRWNSIMDQLSKCIGNFTQLRFLDISHNQFNGKIPTTISKLTSIRYLTVVENHFEGPFLLSSLANLTNLKFFELSETHVGIEKPHWIPKFQLEGLVLNSCNLNDQIAPNIYSFLSSQSHLRSIDLSHNQLNGAFPVWLLHNNSKLLALDLSNNSFSGTLQLPTWKQKLTYLQISSNNFSGKLPNHMAVLSSLIYFNISTNSFEGNLPLSMKQMKHLGHLDVSNNKFSGNLQISIFHGMSHLKVLFLANNNFSGSIFDGLSGSIQAGLGRWLEALDISNNTISGEIPKEIGSRFKNLHYLQISKNRFEGQLPIEICSLQRLTFFDVSQNQLFGRIPSCFNFSSLSFLFMRENHFSGPIPSYVLSNIVVLQVLDLSYNNFSGYFPNWIHRLSSLRVLLMGRNQLHGLIPRELCQVKKISLMDLSSNKFNGSIPSCLNNITFGMVQDSEYSTIYQLLTSFTYPINIRDAHFVSKVKYYGIRAMRMLPKGQVQVTFTTKSRLHSYKGNILKYMSGLDLSSNQLTGNIPIQIGDLVQIYALNLSHNKLVGFIPKEISNLKQLESLDLSNNLLSGNIPTELGGLHSLAIFNVSYNNLSGMLPTSPHFSTYPTSSYYGNSYLCGPYIEHKCSSPMSPQDNELGKEQEAIIDLEAFYWSFIASYVTILLGFVTVLCINPSWRRAWFYFIQVCSSFCK